MNAGLRSCLLLSLLASAPGRAANPESTLLSPDGALAGAVEPLPMSTLKF